MVARIEEEERPSDSRQVRSVVVAEEGEPAGLADEEMYGRTIPPVDKIESE